MLVSSGFMFINKHTCLWDTTDWSVWGWTQNDAQELYHGIHRRTDFTTVSFKAKTQCSVYLLSQLNSQNTSNDLTTPLDALQLYEESPPSRVIQNDLCGWSIYQSSLRPRVRSSYTAENKSQQTVDSSSHWDTVPAPIPWAWYMHMNEPQNWQTGAGDGFGGIF